MPYWVNIFSDIVLPEYSIMIYWGAVSLLFAAFLGAVVTVFVMRDKIKFKNEIKAIFRELPLNIAVVDGNDNMSLVHATNKKYGELKKLGELGEAEARLYRNAFKQISDTAVETVKFEYDSTSMFGHHFTAVVRAVPEEIFGPKRFMISIMDVTEKYESHKRLDMLHEREKIYRIALQMIAQDKKFYDFIGWLLENIVNWLDADLAIIHRFNPETNKIEEISRFSKSNISIDFGDFDKHSEFYRKLANQEIVIYQCETSTPDVDDIEKYLQNHDVKSCLLFGIMSVRKMVGVIGVYYIKKSRNFSDDDYCAIANVGKISQIAYDRGKYLEHLAASEREKGLVIDTIDIPLAIFDSAGKLKSVNAACARLIDKTPPEIKSCSAFSPVCGKKNGDPDCSVRIVMETKQALCKTIKFKDRIFELTYKPIFDTSAEIANIVLAAYDITDSCEPTSNTRQK